MFNKEKNVYLNNNFSTIDELFKFIGEQAVSIGISSFSDKVFLGLKERESQGSTGLEDNFAIPHTRTSAVKTPTVFYLSNNKPIESYNTFDGTPVQNIITLLIPEGVGDTHIKILSAVSSKLMDEKFRTQLKNSTPEDISIMFNEILGGVDMPSKKEEQKDEEQKDEEQKDEEQKTNGLIVGISACPAGIAKTYMSKTVIEKAAAELNYDIEWETQGAGVQKNKLSEESIKKADLVLIASDIEINIDRFKNKRLYKTGTLEAIKGKENYIKKALEKATVYDGSTKHTFKWLINTINTGLMSKFSDFWKFLTLSFGFYALLMMIGTSIYGQTFLENPDAAVLKSLVVVSLIPVHFVLAAIVFGMVLTWTKSSLNAMATAVPTAILSLAAVAIGFTNNSPVDLNAPASLFFSWGDTFNSLDMKMGPNIFVAIVSIITIMPIMFYAEKISVSLHHKSPKYKMFIAPIFDMYFVCLLVGALVIGIVVFLLGGPLSYLNQWSVIWLFEHAADLFWVRAIIGGIIGALICWDLGGTVNKYMLAVIASYSAYDFRLASIMAVAIPIASLALGVHAKIFKKFYVHNDDWKSADKSFMMGVKSLSEGALELTQKYKLKVKIVNVLTGGLVGALIYMIGVTIFYGGLIPILGGSGTTFVAALSGIEFIDNMMLFGEWYSFIIMTLMGIFLYYMVMLIGVIFYSLLASITFGIGKNKIVSYVKKKNNIS